MQADISGIPYIVVLFAKLARAWSQQLWTLWSVYGLSAKTWPYSVLEAYQKDQLQTSRSWQGSKCTLSNLLQLSCNTYARPNQHSNESFVTVGRKRGDAVSFLPRFDCLTHLTFVNTCNRHNDYVTIYDLSVTCPKLRSLKLKCVYANDYDDRLRNILAGLGGQQALLDTINQNMKELEIQISKAIISTWLQNTHQLN